MMKLYSVVLLLASFVFVQSEVETVGQCPRPNNKGIENFKETEYAGVWYEIRRYDNGLITKACGMPTYTLKDKDYEISYITKNEADTANTTDTLKLKRKNPDENIGKYDVYKGDKKEDIGHDILDTDYKTYSIVWGCVSNSENLNRQRLFIYSRQKTFSDADNKAVNKKLEEFNLNTKELKDVLQDDKKCSRNTGTSIVLPTLFTFIFVTLLSKQI